MLVFKHAMFAAIIRAALRLILNQTSIDTLMDIIKKADVVQAGSFSKRGYVYRQLKELEGGARPVSMLNAAIELGVVLHKHLAK